MKLFPLFTYLQAIGNLLPTHLSKYKSELKQNGTQEDTLFLVQFPIPFHMVYSFLLRLLALKNN